MEIIPIEHPRALERASAILNQGKLAAFPTDTIYGLGCTAFSAKSIENIYQVKQRPGEKAIAILIGELDQLKIVAQYLPSLAQRLTEQFWPGALTIIVQRNPNLPGNISQNQTIGIRMPNHEFVRSLLNKTGPLATTSANISGQANPMFASDVLDQLCCQIELLVDGGKTSGVIPSTVVDCTSEIPRILRVGAISEEMINQSSG
jgi:L-threonylcarbamoyladenylate synthase